MKPYTPQSNKGRTVGGDDIHHRTSDMPKSGSKVIAKVAKHSARQDGTKSIAAEIGRLAPDPTENKS